MKNGFFAVNLADDRVSCDLSCFSCQVGFRVLAQHLDRGGSNGAAEPTAVEADFARTRSGEPPSPPAVALPTTVSATFIPPPDARIRDEGWAAGLGRIVALNHRSSTSYRIC